MGWMGMPRRYYDHLEYFHTHHVVATVGSWVLAAGIFFFFYAFLKAVRTGKTAPSNPWRGRTLEWQVSSPPPPENFHEIPNITGGPYEYGHENGGA
jgi:cytochrome c oxidase subunit 1